MSRTKKPPRKKTPDDIETEVLTKSARRCTLCFYLKGDLHKKHGQIAHLDGNRANFSKTNLAFMCLKHHSLYDTKTSQHKNYKIKEVKDARNRLYAAIARRKHLSTRSTEHSEISTVVALGGANVVQGSQSQRAGRSAVQVQASRNVHVTLAGISVAEARQIALDIFKANAIELAGIAREEFESRGREFIEQLLRELLLRKPEAVDSFSDPDMQYVLFTAQRDYARSGREDLQQTLVDLLVQRTTATDLERIVLNEAITVASKLTAAQMDTLSLVLLLVHGAPLRYSFQNLDEFGTYLRENILPFINESLRNDATYLHLKYTGCASMDSGGTGVATRMEETFPACFTLGFSPEQLQNADPNGRLADIVIPCFHYPPALQFKPMDQATFRSLCTARGFTLAEANGMLFIQNNRGLDAEGIFKFLTKVDPKFDIALNQPITNSLVDIQLTSVGIAIANANLRRRSGQDFDLRHWIK